MRTMSWRTAANPISATLSLASHMYTPPMEPSDIKNNLAIRVSYANNSNTVRFEFIVKNHAIDLNRVSRVTVTGTPEGGTSYTSLLCWFYRNDRRRKPVCGL